MSTTATPVAAAAPAAAPTPAPVSSPAPATPAAPVSTPATPSPTPEVTPAATPAAEPAAPAAAPAPGQWKSQLKREDFRDFDSYARAITEERLKALPTDGSAPAAAEPPQPAAAATEAQPATEAAVAQPAAAPAEVDVSAATPYTVESLNKAITDNPEFSKLLEADPALKSTLYKTAREAGEVAAYKKVFPDVKAAEYARGNSKTFVDVRETFLGSTTPEGAQKAVNSIAELCYERDDKGNVVMENGQPVIGDDFYGFVDHIAKSDTEFRLKQVKENLAANRYKNDDERDKDERRLTALEVLMEDFAPASTATGDNVPEELKERFAEVERREKALTDQEAGRKQTERQTFERALVNEANLLINNGIKGIIASVKEQGGILQPYLEQVVDANIGKRLADACAADDTLATQMKDLRLLPPGDESKIRRLEIIDRAIQNLLPDIAKEELRKAGVTWAEKQAATDSKIAAQVDQSKRSETRGATSPSNPLLAGQQQPLTAEQAWTKAKEIWSAQNPKRSVNDPGVRNDLIGIATRLKLGQPIE